MTQNIDNTKRKFRWKNFIDTSDIAQTSGNEETKLPVKIKKTDKDTSNSTSHRIQKFYLNAMSDDEAVNLLLSSCDRLLSQDDFFSN